MNKLMLLLLMTISLSSFAQDKIQLKGSETKEVKILSMRDGFIEFYFLDDPEQTKKKIPMNAVENYYKEGSTYDPTKTKEIFTKEREIYCQIVGRAKFLSNKVVITVDFGQEIKFFQFREELIDPKTGETLVFNSMIDAMNYMSIEKGWTYVDAYTLTVGNQNVYHYVLKKKVQLKDSF